MNYVLADVSTPRKKYPDASTVEGRMLTLNQYHTLARRIIGRWAPAHMKGVMLGSEDAIDYVAHKIMMGDWRYNVSRSDIKTHRGYCGKRAIQRYIKGLARKGPFVTNFLDTLEESETNIYELIADPKSPQPIDVDVIQDERLEMRKRLVKGMERLTDTQYACVKLHFIDGKSMAEVGRELDISREAVRKSINESVERMRGL